MVVAIDVLSEKRGRSGALGVAAQINDHYRCAWGEISSSGCAIHPGERPTRTRICGADSRPWRARAEPAYAVDAPQDAAILPALTRQFSLSPSVFGLSPLIVTMDSASSATTWLATCSTARTSPAGMTAAPEASAKT